VCAACCGLGKVSNKQTTRCGGPWCPQKITLLTLPLINPKKLGLACNPKQLLQSGAYALTSLSTNEVESCCEECRMPTGRELSRCFQILHCCFCCWISCSFSNTYTNIFILVGCLCGTAASNVPTCWPPHHTRIYMEYLWNDSWRVTRSTRSKTRPTTNLSTTNKITLNWKVAYKPGSGVKTDSLTRWSATR